MVLKINEHDHIVMNSTELTHVATQLRTMGACFAWFATNLRDKFSDKLQ